MNPWSLPLVAVKQRKLVDAQLDVWSSPRALNASALARGLVVPQFDALMAAVKATNCSGEVLEVGCASGYNREVLDRAGVGYRSYAGIDINETALAIAKERYPESEWFNPGRLALARIADIVIDGSCVLHIDDWREHLGNLCEASRRWVILHRIPVCDDQTTRTETRAYGQTFPAWSFWRHDIEAEMKARGLVLANSFSADGGSSTLVFARPRHFATYADDNYLSRLKALHASMLRHCGPFVLHVLAWGRLVEGFANATETCAPTNPGNFLDIHRDLRADVLPGPPRSTVEHYWTCGPRFIADVMRSTGEPVTYVDADVMFHSSPETVFAEIGGARAGVVPHGFAEAWRGLHGPTAETHSIFGTFNVGIVHVADVGFADSWANQCRAWCYDRVEAVEGALWPLYGDQKFLDGWPERGAHVVSHPGACLGPWAIHTRALDVRDDVIHFGGRPLVAYHYSGLRELPDGHSVCTRPEYRLTNRQEKILYAPYWKALAEARR